MAKDLPALGNRLQALRKARKLSLEGLAAAAGVSKSMVSQIERNEANPTVGVLWRLTNALDVQLAEFLTIAPATEPTPEITLVTPHATPVITSPDGKCVLKILGPPEMVGKIEWYELRIEPGGVLESEPHAPRAKEHLSVLDGVVEVQAGGATRQAARGETLRYPVDLHHTIANHGETPAMCIMVVEYAGKAPLP